MNEKAPHHASEDPEERRRYYRERQREFQARNKRMQFHLSKEEYAQLSEWYSENKSEPSLPKQIRALVMDTAMRVSYVNNLATQPDKKMIQELIVVLRNMGNNINQISKNLNTEALKQRRVIVADYKESISILEHSFDILRGAEEAIKTLIPTYDGKS